MEFANCCFPTLALAGRRFDPAWRQHLFAPQPAQISPPIHATHIYKSRCHDPVILALLKHRHHCCRNPFLPVFYSSIVLLPTAMAGATAHNILRFHRMEGEVYEKVLSMGRERTEAKNVVALWMWLESMGFPDMVGRVKSSPRSASQRLLREAEAILDCLRQGNPPPARNADALAQTAQSARDPVTLRFFYVHRDIAIRSIVSILDGVGRIIFDDVLILAARDADAGRPVAQALTATLGAPYERGVESTPEDRRSMLLTFLPGQPLPSQMITDYFTGRWGMCVERVEMDHEGTRAGEAPTYGRVVFTSPSFISLFLGGEQFAEFDLDGRQMWGRRYTPWINRVLG